MATVKAVTENQVYEAIDKLSLDQKKQMIEATFTKLDKAVTRDTAILHRNIVRDEKQGGKVSPLQLQQKYGKDFLLTNKEHCVVPILGKHEKDGMNTTVSSYSDMTASNSEQSNSISPSSTTSISNNEISNVEEINELNQAEPAKVILPIPPILKSIEDQGLNFISDEKVSAQPEIGVKSEKETQARAKIIFISNIKRKILRALDRHYILTNRCPDLILPRGPSDEEKYSYINTRRFIFLPLGLLAFLSASAGLWLFTLCSPYFYWYGPVAAMLQFHISISYFLGLSARDFDLKAHKQILEENKLDNENSPTVDVLLPVCKESMVVLKNTWNHVSRLQYAQNKLKVWVLDDGAMDEVKDLATSFGFNYIRRENRPYFRKAGNLRNAFAITEGDYFVIFDADFCPRADFLLEIIPRMIHDPSIAICQTPQYFKTRPEHTWVERGASEVQELFYRWTQVNRDKYGSSICVGSNAIYRREALKETGGTALVGASEDVHTGFYAITRGWKLRYIPICLASGMSPDNPRACFSQQIRWSQGSTSLLLNGQFHRAKLGFIRKLCFLSGMLYYWTSSISMFTLPMPGIFIVWLRPELIRYYNLAFALPSIIYGILIFKLWSTNSHSLATQQIRILQGWAYLFGIKDRILGKTHEWVVSGANTMAASNSEGETNKVKKSNNVSVYEQARRAAFCWLIISQGAFWSGCAYLLTNPARMVAIGFKWYDLFPQMLLFVFHFYCTLPFLLSVSA